MDFLAYCARLRDGLIAAKHQGVIFWNLEGRQNNGTDFPGQLHFVEGVPELMYRPAGQADNTLVAGLKILTDAGLHIGTCIRPWQLQKASDGNVQIGVGNEAVLLTSLMAYQIALLGPNANLFYLDSNWQDAIDVYTAVKAVKSTGVALLVFIENSFVAHWAAGPDFGGSQSVDDPPLDQKWGIGCELAKQLWPAAFSGVRINTPHGETRSLTECQAAVKAGNILISSWGAMERAQQSMPAGK